MLQVTKSYNYIHVGKSIKVDTAEAKDFMRKSYFGGLPDVRFRFLPEHGSVVT